MKYFKLFICICIISFASNVFAETNAEKEATKLLNTVGLEQALSQAISQMLEVQIKQNPKMTPYKGVMQKFFNKYMSYESLKPEMVKMYSEAFTAQELKDINAFYQTPTGKKAIQKMPELVAKGNQIGMARVQSNIGELQKMIAAEEQRIKQAR